MKNDKLNSPKELRAFYKETRDGRSPFSKDNSDYGKDQGIFDFEYVVFLEACLLKLQNPEYELKG